MKEMPAFIEDYLSAMTEPEAMDKLLQFDKEYRAKYREAEQDSINKDGSAFEFRLRTGEKIESTVTSTKKALEQEYKKLVMDASQPYIDAATFEKLAEKHAPEVDKKNFISLKQASFLRKREDLAAPAKTTEKEIAEDKPKVPMSEKFLKSLSFADNRNDITDPGKDNKDIGKD